MKRKSTTAVKTKATPVKPRSRAKVSEISDEERRARTSSNHDDWKKVLQLGNTKNLHIQCEDYREARLLAQKLTATRSYYGYDVKIQHRGKDIYLSPREPGVELDTVTLDSDPSPETMT